MPEGEEGDARRVAGVSRSAARSPPPPRAASDSRDTYPRFSRWKTVGWCPPLRRARSTRGARGWRRWWRSNTACSKRRRAVCSPPGSCSSPPCPRKTCWCATPGGGCADVLGAPAEALMCTSLFDGLHAEDVRNLVFAFHLFPTILPEMANLAWAENDKPASQREREAALEQGKEERLLPLPDAARLLPHGYLRRRLADGRFIGMERLGGVIVCDAAAAAARAATRPSVESLSSFFQSGASLKSDEPSAHSSSSPSPATANATATGSDETAAARASPAFERPYPCFRTGADGAKRRDEHADTPEVATHVTTSETTEAERRRTRGGGERRRTKGGADARYVSPVSEARRAASRDGETVTRSGHSAPEASTLSAVAATFSPAVASEAAKTVAPGGAGEDSSTASGEGARGVADVPDGGGRRGAEQVSPRRSARRDPITRRRRLRCRLSWRTACATRRRLRRGGGDAERGGRHAPRGDQGRASAVDSRDVQR